MKVARIYIRVSTNEQDLSRQDALINEAKAQGYYIANVYREKASGARADRPELLRMINDLQPGEVVIAEQIDRISRLPLDEAMRLVEAIKSKGARLSVPGVVDLSDIDAKGIAKVVMDCMQDMILKMTLQIAREDYEIRRKRQKQGIERAKKKGKYPGRPPDKVKHEAIIAHRTVGRTVSDTARLVGCSEPLVKLVWREYQKNRAGDAN